MLTLENRGTWNMGFALKPGDLSKFRMLRVPIIIVYHKNDKKYFGATVWKNLMISGSFKIALIKHLFDFTNFQKRHSYYIGVTLSLEWNFGCSSNHKFVNWNVWKYSNQTLNLYLSYETYEICFICCSFCNHLPC